jgi:hypothetical protein
VLLADFLPADTLPAGAVVFVLDAALEVDPSALPPA